MISNPDISDLIGKPFKDYGRGPDGYDCWGTVIAVAARYGIVIPDYGHYHHEDAAGVVGEFERRRFEWIEINKRDKPEICDVVMFKRTDGALHFGIVIEDGFFVQANADLCVHICRLNHPLYRQLIRAFYRLK